MRFPALHFPEQASAIAARVDGLAFFMLAGSAVIIVLVVAAIAYSAIRYRRRSDSEFPEPENSRWPALFALSVIPFGFAMIAFRWGAGIYRDESRPPGDAIQIYAVAKQWMWKLQHMEGQREINELHVPVGRAVKITMTSEDVIHSFFTPAFRTRQDIVPGRYSTTWFTATKPGKYRLVCSEYCGMNHSEMTGWIYAMEPKDYKLWLAGGPKGTLIEEGKKLFEDLACIKCHKEDGSGRCPALRGLFGQTILLTGGATVEADEAYIRESIVDPAAKVVDGYQPFMPVFKDKVTEDQLVALIAYIKSLPRKPQTDTADQTP